MANKKNAPNATVKESAHVKAGDPFLAAHVDVARDGETVTLPANHFLSELDTDLTDEEKTGLQAQGLVRPGTEADMAHATARHSQSAQTKLERKQFAERQKLQAKHVTELKRLDVEAAKAKSDMLVKHGEERDQLEQELAKQTADGVPKPEPSPSASGDLALKQNGGRGATEGQQFADNGQRTAGPA